MRSLRSLHVGLNYPGTVAELAGCVNDAFDWEAFFTARGYDAQAMIEPTSAELLDRMRERVVGLKWGDRFVLTFSGHGSFVPDLNGDEVDGLDEVICLADYAQRVVTDDQLAAAFDRAPVGVRRTFLSDSCHSGSINRFAGSPLAGRKARFLPPSIFMPTRQAKLLERVVNSDRVLVANPSRVGAALISGCADREYSYDAWFGARANGAFTRVAIDAYKAGDTMVRWHRAIRSVLPNSGFPQSPQLQARAHQRYWRL